MGIGGKAVERTRRRATAPHADKPIFRAKDRDFITEGTARMVYHKAIQ